MSYLKDEIFLLLLGLNIIFIMIIKNNRSKSYNKNINIPNKLHTVIYTPTNSTDIKQNKLNTFKINTSNQSEYPHLRSNNNFIKINEKTRGTPEHYNLIGVLYNEDKKYNLYGRSAYRGSYEWEYYIEGNDTGGLVYTIPLDNQKEIIDGSLIKIPTSNLIFRAKIYKLDKYKYIPYIKN